MQAYSDLSIVNNNNNNSQLDYCPVNISIGSNHGNSNGNTHSSAYYEALTHLLPYLKNFGILGPQATVNDIRENDLKELAIYWGINISNHQPILPVVNPSNNVLPYSLDININTGSNNSSSSSSSNNNNNNNNNSNSNNSNNGLSNNVNSNLNGNNILNSKLNKNPIQMNSNKGISKYNIPILSSNANMPSSNLSNSIPMKADQLVQILVHKSYSFSTKGESLAKKLIHFSPTQPNFWTNTMSLSSSVSNQQQQHHQHHQHYLSGIAENSGNSNSNSNSNSNGSVTTIDSPSLRDSNNGNSNNNGALRFHVFNRNFYGLPHVNDTISTDTIVSKCRKPLLSSFRNEAKDSLSDWNLSYSSEDSKNKEGSEGSLYDKNNLSHADSNIDAQRKVATSLLTMAKNEAMTTIFVTKGGIDSVFRLITDTNDIKVLRILALCFLQVLQDGKQKKALLDKGILSAIISLADKGDEVIHNIVAKILAKLTAKIPKLISNSNQNTNNSTLSLKDPLPPIIQSNSNSNLNTNSNSYPNPMQELDMDEQIVNGGILPLTLQLITNTPNGAIPTNNPIMGISNSNNNNNNFYDVQIQGQNFSLSSVAGTGIGNIVQMGIETICVLLIAVCNVALVASDDDVEALVRILLQAVRRLDVTRNYDHAYLVMDCVCNLTRVQQFCAPLVEESVLPLLIHLLETHITNEMLEMGSEAFVNISGVRRNRREIASSGISNHLDRLLSSTYSIVRPNTLTMIGNLLDSGLFHDKIAKSEIVNNILHYMLDYSYHDMTQITDPDSLKKQSRANQQFIAVSFFLAQLAHTHNNVQTMTQAATVLIECGAIEKVLKMIRVASCSSATACAAQYLWTFLVSVSYEMLYFETLMESVSLLLREIHTEAYESRNSTYSAENSKETKDSMKYFPEEAAQIIFNISVHPKIGDYLQDDHISKIISSVKLLMEGPKLALDNTVISGKGSKPIAPPAYITHSRLYALKALVNFGLKSMVARIYILGYKTRKLSRISTENNVNSTNLETMSVLSNMSLPDNTESGSKFNLVTMLETFIDTINPTKQETPILHLLFASLLNSLSLEENLIPRLLEIETLKFLILMNDKSFTPSPNSKMTRQQTKQVNTMCMSSSTLTTNNVPGGYGPGNGLSDNTMGMISRRNSLVGMNNMSLNMNRRDSNGNLLGLRPSSRGSGGVGKDYRDEYEEDNRSNMSEDDEDGEENTFSYSASPIHYYGNNPNHTHPSHSNANPTSSIITKIIGMTLSNTIIPSYSNISNNDTNDNVDHNNNTGSGNGNSMGNGSHKHGIVSVDMELGKGLIAATIHNLMCKRASIIPGTITCLLNLLRNCRDGRVVLCTRALAHMSLHPKSKIGLAKEAKLIPEMTAIMRFGCEDADRVQYYGAIIICNILATQIDRAILDKLIVNGAVVDLVVVSLLRINAFKTKETLAKSLFNLMARADYRKELVLGGPNKGDLLAAMIELSKVDTTELVELCARTIYNISCEIGGSNLPGVSSSNSSSISASNANNDSTIITTTYADKMSSLHSINWLISKLVPSAVAASLGLRVSPAVKLLSAMALTNLSFDRKLATDLANHPRVVDAIKAISSLAGDEALYCATVLIYNLSQSNSGSLSLATADANHGKDIIDILINGLHTSTMLVIQISIASLVNLSRQMLFYEILTNLALKEIVKIMVSPQTHIHIKLDSIRLIYNLVTQYRPARVSAIETEVTAALWKILKLTGSNTTNNALGLMNHNIVAPVATTTTIVTSSSSYSSPQKDSVLRNGYTTESPGKPVGSPSKTIGIGQSIGINMNNKGHHSSYGLDDESIGLVRVIGKIIKELCYEAENENMHKRLLQDGVMNMLLRLSKVEIPELKLDISTALLSLTCCVSNHHDTITMKVLKWDAIDILFWLTLHDCLGLNDPIKKNVGRALRNFSIVPNEAEILAKEERFVSVLKALIKSKNEDVLWQAAGVIYNVLGYEPCKKHMLSKGITSLIFELANAGYATVRHVCSASLHLLQGQLPDMEDPMVLQLLWYLLEGDGEKLIELKERSVSPEHNRTTGTSSNLDNPTNNGSSNSSNSSNVAMVTYGAMFEHKGSQFAPSWLPLTCEVDTRFKASQTKIPEGHKIRIAVKSLQLSKGVVSLTHQKKNPSDYRGVLLDNSNTASSILTMAVEPRDVVSSSQSQSVGRKKSLQSLSSKTMSMLEDSMSFSNSNSNSNLNPNQNQNSRLSLSTPALDAPHPSNSRSSNRLLLSSSGSLSSRQIGGGYADNNGVNSPVPTGGTASSSGASTSRLNSALNSAVSSAVSSAMNSRRTSPKNSGNLNNIGNRKALSSVNNSEYEMLLSEVEHRFTSSGAEILYPGENFPVAKNRSVLPVDSVGAIKKSLAVMDSAKDNSNSHSKEKIKKLIFSNS